LTDVFAASETVREKLYVPAVVGTPLNVPDDERERPGGTAPEVTSQTYELLPPLAVNVTE